MQSINLLLRSLTLLLLIPLFATAVWPQDHFYTTSANERDNAEAHGFKFEGPCCFVSTTKQTGTKPLFRVRNLQSGDHFYTTSESERDQVSSKYISEGPCCYVLVAPTSSVIPLNRLFNPASGDHLYTTNVEERDRAIASFGYREDGNCCLVS